MGAVIFLYAVNYYVLIFCRGCLWQSANQRNIAEFCVGADIIRPVLIQRDIV